MRILTAVRLASWSLAFAGVTAFAADAPADLSKSKGDQQKSNEASWVRRTDPAMEHWRDDKFGIMIHWGIYAIPGGVWNGRVVPYAAEWIKSAAPVPTADYERLATQFNPTNYDPVAWAKQFKQAGAKYVVITTKHHDGFCLFDSKYTDYDVAHSPYGKDLLKPLAAALRAQGIDVGFTTRSSTGTTPTTARRSRPTPTAPPTPATSST